MCLGPRVKSNEWGKQLKPEIERHQGWIEMIVAMTISGTIGVCVLKSRQSAENVVFVRCGAGFACLLPFCWYRRMICKRYFAPRLLTITVAAGVLMVVNWVLLFKAFSLVTIGFATIVYHVNPFLILIGAALFMRQRITRKDVGWTALAFVGFVILVNPGSAIATLNIRQLSGIAGDRGDGDVFGNGSIDEAALRLANAVHRHGADRRGRAADPAVRPFARSA